MPSCSTLEFIIPIGPSVNGRIFKIKGKSLPRSSFFSLVAQKATEAAVSADWQYEIGDRLSVSFRLHLEHNRSDIDNRFKSALDAIATALKFNDRSVDEFHVYRDSSSPTFPYCQVSIGKLSSEVEAVEVEHEWLRMAERLENKAPSPIPLKEKRVRRNTVDSPEILSRLEQAIKAGTSKNEAIGFAFQKKSVSGNAYKNWSTVYESVAERLGYSTEQKFEAAIRAGLSKDEAICSIFHIKGVGNSVYKRGEVFYDRALDKLKSTK